MSLRAYTVTVGGAGETRELLVPSPTDVQAADAAAPLMREGESILSIAQTSDDSQPLDGPPPKSQAAELAPVTPGVAAAPEPGSTSRFADDDRRGLVAGGLGGPSGQMLEDGQEQVFAREEVEAGQVEHHTGEEAEATAANTADRPGAVDGDAAELNRGLGQTRVGEVGPGPDQRSLDPAGRDPAQADRSVRVPDHRAEWACQIDSPQGHADDFDD